MPTRNIFLQTRGPIHISPLVFPFSGLAPSQTNGANDCCIREKVRRAKRCTSDREYYNYFRYYDPSTGRYITSDPIGLEGGLNTYLYANANPLFFIDPFGLNPLNSPGGNWGLGDPTSGGYVGDAVGGVGDFYQNYQDMRDANTIGGDKYFHCKANCEAAQRGDGGQDAAECISDAREWADENIKGDSSKASEADQIANQWGRSQGSANPGASCSSICKVFRPNGLPPQY